MAGKPQSFRSHPYRRDAFLRERWRKGRKIVPATEKILPPLPSRCRGAEKPCGVVSRISCAHSNELYHAISRSKRESSCESAKTWKEIIHHSSLPFRVRKSRKRIRKIKDKELALIKESRKINGGQRKSSVINSQRSGIFCLIRNQ